MPTATVRFDHIIQDSQDYGSDDEHMVSRVFLSLEAGGKVYPGLMVDIKQTLGSRIEDSPLEVSRPKGYSGAFDYAAFRALVEEYFRSQIGSRGSAIRIEGSSNVRMRNNTVGAPMVATFDYTSTSASW